MSNVTCDDCGKEAPVLVLTDYGCRYCRDCLRPGAIADKPKAKKQKTKRPRSEDVL